MSAALKASVRAALAGNLWIDDSQVGIRTEDALMYVAAAQLKAVAIALVMDEPPDEDGDGWCMNGVLSKKEASAAISGVASLLANARVILPETEGCPVPSESGAVR